MAKGYPRGSEEAVRKVSREHAVPMVDFQSAERLVGDDHLSVRGHLQAAQALLPEVTALLHQGTGPPTAQGVRTSEAK